MFTVSCWVKTGDITFWLHLRLWLQIYFQIIKTSQNDVSFTKWSDTCKHSNNWKLKALLSVSTIRPLLMGDMFVYNKCEIKCYCSSCADAEYK